MRMFGKILAVLLLVVATLPACAQERGLAGFGIVLMHGKGGQPGAQLASLAAALEEQGAKVVMPRMAWAGVRGRPDAYDVPYDQALTRIDAEIAQLRKQGARRIVIGGQSLGANAALAFAARRGNGLAGIMALAPGHTPERMGRPDILRAVEHARELVGSGRGGARESFPDVNQGQSFQVEGTAQAWLSFNDPRGPANMPHNAAAMAAVPFLWVIGTNDPLVAAGRDYAFTLARPNAKSRYVEISAGHLDTPDRARAEVIAWLKSL